MFYRARIVGIVALLFSSSAIAADGADPVKVWTGTEGICADWAITWQMTKVGDGSYTGAATQYHQGGSCVAKKGDTLTGEVAASISGSTITATVSHSDGNKCTYKGTLQGTHVTGGTQSCANIPGNSSPWEMTIIP